MGISITRGAFFLVNDIDRDRKERNDTKTLAGTRKLHCIRSTGDSFALLTRNLSCFCNYCVNEEGTECTNSSIVENWDMQLLLRNSHTSSAQGSERGTNGRGQRLRGSGRGGRRNREGQRNRGGEREE